MITAILLFATVSIIAVENASADENYHDHSNEYSKGEQPDPDDIPGMNRSEDRTRNKDN